LLGSLVAGTFADWLDGVGVVGVGAEVAIMALKFLGDDPACGFDDQAIAAIAYAKSFGVHIANASWGGPGLPGGSPDLHDAIANSGMLFVAAAGNDGLDNDAETEPILPASFDLPNIISVAAIDNSGGLAWFSDFGAKTVDIAAPGESILSSLPADKKHAQPYWDWLSGTSMAAPHVTGTAALVASMSPTLAAEPVAMKAHLLASGKPDAATAGLTLTGKIVDAYRALDLVPPVAVAPSSFGVVVGSVASATNLSVKVGWPAASDDMTGIVAYGLQSRAGTGAWLTARGSTPDRSTIRTLRPGTSYGFRVRAMDGAGNWSPYTASLLRPSFYQETSSGASYTRSWGHWRTSSASGGTTRFATRAGASVTFRFSGRGFALVAPKGPTRGSARLYVDGVLVSTVSEFRAGSQARIVVAARAWSRSGAHTVKLVVLGTVHHPRFDVDAFAVLR
jgi:subtilisin family serine protease